MLYTVHATKHQHKSPEENDSFSSKGWAFFFYFLGQPWVFAQEANGGAKQKKKHATALVIAGRFLFYVHLTDGDTSRGLYLFDGGLKWEGLVCAWYPILLVSKWHGERTNLPESFRESASQVSSSPISSVLGVLPLSCQGTSRWEVFELHAHSGKGHIDCWHSRISWMGNEPFLRDAKRGKHWIQTKQCKMAKIKAHKESHSTTNVSNSVMSVISPPLR